MEMMDEDMMSLSSGDSPPPSPATGAQRSGKKRKTISFEDEDGEEVNQVSMAQNTEEEETEDNDDDEEEEVRQDVKPIGDVVRVSGEGESRRNHFKGFEADGVSYELEDTVLISPEEEEINMKPGVAIIKDVSVNSDGKIMVTGRSFYRPQFANLGEEIILFYTFEDIEFAAELVMHKCRVYFVPSNKRIPSCKEYPGFIVQKVFDAKLKRIYAILDDYVGFGDDTWQHEVFGLVQKTKDQIPNWT